MLHQSNVFTLFNCRNFSVGPKLTTILALRYFRSAVRCLKDRIFN